MMSIPAPAYLELDVDLAALLVARVRGPGSRQRRLSYYDVVPYDDNDE